MLFSQHRVAPLSIFFRLFFHKKTFIPLLFKIERYIYLKMTFNQEEFEILKNIEESQFFSTKDSWDVKYQRW